MLTRQECRLASMHLCMDLLIAKTPYRVSHFIMIRHTILSKQNHIAE